MGVLAIDFGTSRIKAAYWDEAKGEAVMLPLGNGGRLYVPSLFHVNPEGKIRFGEAAERELHHDPSGVLSSLKLELDKAYHYLPEREQVKTSTLMTLLFRQLIEHSVREVRGFNGMPPEKVVVTYPAKLDYEDIYRDALKEAGYKGETVFIREPEAAGWAWVKEEKPEPGELLVVLDFGGGTIDWACLRVDENNRPVMIPELRSDGMKAAGVDVDEGLFDEMMSRIGESQREYVQKHRALVMEQICQMKESQNSKAMLSGDEGQTLEVRLGAESFFFEPKLFADVVRRKVVNQALGRIEEYLKKVVDYQRNGGSKQFWCMLAGGTRLLSGLEEQVKKRVKEIGKSGGMEVQFAEIAQADFATVRGAVLWQCQKQDATQPIEREAVVSATPSIQRLKEIKPQYKRYLPGLAGIVMVLITAFFMVTGFQKSGRSRDVEVKTQPKQAASSVEVPENFVLIRGGEFTMGSPTDEPERHRDETQHQVKVRDFYICKYEVTQAEWESVTGTNPSTFKGKNLPVESVSWDDCQAFIKALNRKTGKTYRLPTEAEWEYACRAGTITAFNTGGNLTTDQANYDGNYPYNNNPAGQYREKTLAVDSFEPNAWGLYNMHGNVMEWCSDWYGENYYDECKAKGVVENPTGPISGSDRVLRGGYYGSSLDRSADRFYFGRYPVMRGCDGFRLVFVP